MGADQFVKGIVAPDIFMAGKQMAAGVEERGRMDTAGMGKNRLGRAGTGRELGQDPR